MRKNQVKLMAVGMLVLALMTGCGSGNNNVDEGLSNIVPIDIEDDELNVEGQESQVTIKDEKESQATIKDEEESQATHTGSQQMPLADNLVQLLRTDSVG